MARLVDEMIVWDVYGACTIEDCRYRRIQDTVYLPADYRKLTECLQDFVNICESSARAL
jgi:hypothetical protein